MFVTCAIDYGLVIRDSVRRDRERKVAMETAECKNEMGDGIWQ